MPFLWRVWGLDDLSFGMQQDGIGVRPGPEEPVTVVEVVVESLRELVRAAVFAIIWDLLLRTGRVSLPEVDQIRVLGAAAVVLLGLHGDQGGGQPGVLADRVKSRLTSYLIGKVKERAGFS